MARTKASARKLVGGKAPRRIVATPAQFKTAKPVLKRRHAMRVEPEQTGDTDTEPECNVDAADFGNGVQVVMFSGSSEAAIKKLEALMMEHIECEAKGEPYNKRACLATRIAWYKAKLQFKKQNP